ncbi:MAG TPA: vWA domain-containing protein [Myxococcota bacterium]|jgi:Mg-chelatase subunit ChlD
MPRCERLAIAAAGLLFAALSARADSTVQLRLESPMPGTHVEGFVHQARISGSALADAADPQRFDVMLVIDVSYSTRTASGGDIDGDGVVGVDPIAEGLIGMFPDDVRSTDLEDTILRAQVRAALTLLEDLDPRRVRVGVITFSGEVDPTTGMRLSETQRDAEVVIPLTGDYAAVRSALAGVVARGPHGATNFGAGILLAVTELSGLSSAKSQPRTGAKRVVLFLTDGLPTFPIGKGTVVDEGDEEFALRAADLANSVGISINTYALGPEALKYNRTTTEVARITGGVYTPVQSPDDVIALLAGTTFSNIEDVVFTNLTTGDFSTDVRLAPDGSFAGYVPVREGRNRVRIVALASDGTRGELELELDFALGQVGSRDKLGELERIRRQNRDLELKRRNLEIEAFRAQQRRTLEIKVKDDGEERGRSEETPAPAPPPAPAPAP